MKLKSCIALIISIFILCFTSDCVFGMKKEGVSIITKNINGKIGNFSYEYKIPQISGLADTSFQKKINNELLEAVDVNTKAKQEFIKWVNENTSNSTDNNYAYTKETLEYTIYCNNDKYLSIHYSLMNQSPWFGIRPDITTFVFNYDLRNKTNLYIGNLFVNELEAKEYISKNIQDIIGKGAINATSPDFNDFSKIRLSGSNVTPLLFDFCNLTSDNQIIINFTNEYIAASYGMPSYSITLPMEYYKEYPTYDNSIEDIIVVLNGNSIDMVNKPFVENGSVMIPVSDLVKAFGSNVYWDGESRCIVFQMGLETIVFRIDNNKVFKRNKGLMETSSKIVEDIAYVPLLFFKEAFGAAISWNSALKQASISIEPITDKKILDEFYFFGMGKFNYYGSFIANHGDLNYAFIKVMSEISDFGQRIISGIIKKFDKIAFGNASKYIGMLDEYQSQVIEENILLILSNIDDNGESLKLLSKNKIFDEAVKVSNTLSEAISYMTENTARMTTKEINNYKLFKDALDKIDFIGTWGGLAVEVFSDCYKNHIDKMDYLDVIEKATPESDKVVRYAIDNLKLKFSNKIISSYSNFLEVASSEIISKGFKNAVSLFSKKNIGPAYSLSTIAIEYTYKFTGGKEYADNIEQATALMATIQNLMIYYENIKQKVIDNSGNITTDKELWNEFVYSFKLCKAGIIESYKCMLNITKDPLEKQYLKYQIHVINSINISKDIPANKDDIFSLNKD